MDVESVRQRIEKSIERIPEAGCWIWMGTRRGMRYGSIRVDGHDEAAHRVSYKVYRGDIGTNNVCHICDVPLCVNPYHLFLGTQSENVKDAVRKGRWIGHGQPKGQDHAMAKLTWAEVDCIRTLWNIKAVSTKKELAARYGVGEAQICKIILNKQWKDS